MRINIIENKKLPDTSLLFLRNVMTWSQVHSKQKNKKLQYSGWNNSIYKKKKEERNVMNMFWIIKTNTSS